METEGFERNLGSRLRLGGGEIERNLKMRNEMNKCEEKHDRIDSDSKKEKKM